MSNDSIIQIEQLGKCYRLGHTVDLKRTFRETVADLPRRLWRSNGQNEQSQTPNDAFWALQDINLEIFPGEVIGIIGKNGAGKSTLLKILSRITEPSTGRAKIHGRLASLLEVGTGFHPELTGRENIYLNGTILGMKRAEIDQKFDEIVAFAEIEQFLDTPVKRYSSGMYVRLAFAVAAHLEPEIMIVDEVLAVGDVSFQKKCLGKMEKEAHGGRTILFVSHQMNAVQSLCTRCVWLDKGKIKQTGSTESVIRKYMDVDGSVYSWEDGGTGDFPQNEYFNLRKMKIVDRTLQPVERLVGADETVGIYLEGELAKYDPALVVGFALYSSLGPLLFWSLFTDARQENWLKVQQGTNRMVAWLPAHFLNEGDYRIEPIVSLHFRDWLIQPGVNAPSIKFSIQGGLSESPYWRMARPGLMAPILEFEAV